MAVVTDAVGTVLAHQGGWDEILFVLAPLAVFALLLVMARRRVDRLEQDAPPEHTDDEPPTDP